MSETLDREMLFTKISAAPHDVRRCPFCDTDDLKLCVAFSGTAARVECYHCLAQGPWAWHESREIAVYDALKAWNGFIQKNTRH